MTAASPLARVAWALLAVAPMILLTTVTAAGSRVLHGLLSDGSVYTLDVTTGVLSATHGGSAAEMSRSIARSACAHTGLSLLALTEDGATGGLALTAFDLSGKTPSSLLLNLSEVGFAVPSTAAAFSDGLDWYLQQGQQDESVFIVGGDALGFEHVVQCNFSKTNFLVFGGR